MARRQHIDGILRDWRYDPRTLNVRVVKGDDGRRVLQMRVDMGLLQLESEGRPDGERPGGSETYYDFLVGLSMSRGKSFELDEEQRDEVDREFVQFYHRRMCWLRLQEYRRAVQDADHTLGLMDFCKKHSPDEQWTLSHEQYRAFVLFHRIQAAALAELEDHRPEVAVQEVNLGLERMRQVFSDHGFEEVFDEDELVTRLSELRESIRQQYDVGATLEEQLATAVANEQYELAAQIRDQIARRE